MLSWTVLNNYVYILQMHGIFVQNVIRGEIGDSIKKLVMDIKKDGCKKESLTVP